MQLPGLRKIIFATAALAGLLLTAHCKASKNSSNSAKLKSALEESTVLLEKGLFKFPVSQGPEQADSSEFLYQVQFNEEDNPLDTCVFFHGLGVSNTLVKMSASLGSKLVDFLKDQVIDLSDYWELTEKTCKKSVMVLQNSMAPMQEMARRSEEFISHLAQKPNVLSIHLEGHSKGGATVAWMAWDCATRKSKILGQNLCPRISSVHTTSAMNYGSIQPIYFNVDDLRFKDRILLKTLGDAVSDVVPHGLRNATTRYIDEEISFDSSDLGWLPANFQFGALTSSTTLPKQGGKLSKPKSRNIWQRIKVRFRYNRYANLFDREAFDQILLGYKNLSPAEKESVISYLQRIKLLGKEDLYESRVFAMFLRAYANTDGAVSTYNALAPCKSSDQYLAFCEAIDKDDFNFHSLIYTEEAAIKHFENFFDKVKSANH